MTAPRLGDRDRRALRLGLAVLSMALVVRLSAVSAGRYRAFAQEVDMRTQRLGEARLLVGSIDSMRDSLALLSRVMVGLAPRFVGGQSAGDAQASLAAFLSSTAERNRVKLEVVDALRDSVAMTFHRIGARVEARGDARGLTRWIGSLEEGEPVLRIENLSLVPANPLAPSDRAESLRLSVTVYGWATYRVGP